MKIDFNTHNIYKAKNGHPYKCIKNQSFGSIQTKSAYIPFTNIKKISSEIEYDTIINKLRDKNYWRLFKCDKFEEALMPYISKDDISYRINLFLRENELLDNRYSGDFLENIIRTMDYALNKIDKIYGKYEGIVYRYGKTDKTSKNFVSAARDPNGVKHIIPDDERREFKKPFYIIQTKNGHKIEEVQKKLKYNDVYTDETEILISPCKFEEVDENLPEMQDAKIKLKNALLKERFNDYPKISFFKEI